MLDGEMICILNVGQPCPFTLKLKKIDEETTNLELLEWVISYIKTVRDLANKYVDEDTSYVFVEIPIQSACLYWKGDSQSLRNTIFHLMFSANMYTDSVVNYEEEDTPIDIITKVIQCRNTQKSALDLLADVATRSATSLWTLDDDDK